MLVHFYQKSNHVISVTRKSVNQSNSFADSYQRIALIYTSLTSPPYSGVGSVSVGSVSVLYKQSKQKSLYLINALFLIH